MEEVHQGSTYAQPLHLYSNNGGRFTEMLHDSFPPRVGRGLAIGDYDDDGDVDVVTNNIQDVPRLLRNDTPRVGTAIGLKLQGAPPSSNRDAYGARVTWEAFGKRRVREARAGGSFGSSSDPRLLLAVAADAGPTKVTIRWQGGQTETLELAPGAYHHAVEGQGVTKSVPFKPASP